MVGYMQEGQPNEELLNLELFMTKLLSIYLKEVKHNDAEKNKSVLDAFLRNFKSINTRLEEKNKKEGSEHGLYILPAHRSFAFYFTRLMMFNMVDDKNLGDPEQRSLTQKLRSIFVANLSKENQ